jgi:hypothetical protein
MNQLTAKEFASVLDGISTQQDCLDVLGDPDDKQTRQGPTGIIVGEQWVYRKRVKGASGLNLDANLFWHPETKKLVRARLFNMESYDGLSVE